MKNIRIRAALALCGAMTLGGYAQDAKAGCSSVVYAGSICFMATGYCPKGYTRVEGQVLAAAQDQVLYALLGDAYGQVSQGSFQLPDLRGRSVIGTGLDPVSRLVVSRGDKLGVETVALSGVQMPPHSHDGDIENVAVQGALNVSSQPGAMADPEGNFLAASSNTQSPQYVPGAPATSVSMKDGMILLTQGSGQLPSTTSAGNGQAFGVRGPGLGLLACMANGENLFPPRSR